MYLLKNSEQISLKKVVGILFLIFAGLLIVGCSTEGTVKETEAKAETAGDKNEQAIRAVIENEFNGPDRTYNELEEKMWESGKDYADSAEGYEDFTNSPEYEELFNHIEETYAAHFTDNGYDNFVNSNQAFMYSNFDHDYKLSTSNVEIGQSKNGKTLYDFTFQVEYINQNGEPKQFNFEGNAIVPEEGKIGKIEYLDGFEGGLHQVLNNDEQK